MTKITFVAHDIGPTGGMESALSELITGLVATGAHITVIARTCDLGDLDVVFHRVRGPRRPFVVSYPWFFLAAGVVVRRHRAGLVQTTGAIVPNRVAIVAMHFCHRGFAAKGNVLRSSRRSPLFVAHARLAAAFARLGESFCLRPSRTSTVVAVSRGLADEVCCHYPRLAESVVVIPNGVDLRRFAPNADSRSRNRACLGLDDGALTALFIGGDWERKGLRPAIEALANATQWRLLVVGKGDERRYAAIAQQSRVSARVRFLGHLGDVAPILQAGDVLILPTAYEADPLVAIEAAASGLPLLATPVNGIVDLIGEQVGGLFIERDAGSIAKCLRILAADPALLSRMGAEARAATRHRSWHAVVRRYQTLYATLESRGGRATTIL